MIFHPAKAALKAWKWLKERVFKKSVQSFKLLFGFCLYYVRLSFAILTGKGVQYLEAHPKIRKMKINFVLLTIRYLLHPI